MIPFFRSSSKMFKNLSPGFQDEFRFSSQGIMAKSGNAPKKRCRTFWHNNKAAAGLFCYCVLMNIGYITKLIFLTARHILQE